MKLFTFEFETEHWVTENKEFEAEGLDFEDFSTELAYGSLTIDDAKNKKIRIPSVEICYLIAQLEFLLNKFETKKIQNNQTIAIKSMHQHFYLECWYEQGNLYVLDKNIDEPTIEDQLVFDMTTFKKELILFKQEIKNLLEKYYPNFKTSWENF